MLRQKNEVIIAEEDVTGYSDGWTIMTLAVRFLSRNSRGMVTSEERSSMEAEALTLFSFVRKQSDSASLLCGV